MKTKRRALSRSKKSRKQRGGIITWKSKLDKCYKEFNLSEDKNKRFEETLKYINKYYEKQDIIIAQLRSQLNENDEAYTKARFIQDKLVEDQHEKDIIIAQLRSQLNDYENDKACKNDSINDYENDKAYIKAQNIQNKLVEDQRELEKMIADFSQNIANGQYLIG